MNRKTIIYYCQPYFLDSSLETLNCIKYDIDIHLIIEISNDSQKSTILDFSGKRFNTGLYDAHEVLSPTEIYYFKHHFSSLKSVKFLFFSGQRAISFWAVIGSMELYAFVAALRPSCIHFDSSSLRALWCLPFLRNMHIVVTIHDPVPHEGEKNWKFYFTNFIFRKYASSVVLYSEFSKDLFHKCYPGFKNIHQLKLLPYHFVSQFGNITNTHGSYILFFGRISAYKGIDILLQSIPEVLRIYPTEKFVIAGKPESEDVILSPSIPNTSFILQHLIVPDLAKLISNAKFIVCPYREATQSGVLMTAIAFNKTVLASNVGSFPEYIVNETNGLLADLDCKSISNGIIRLLDNNYYEKLNKKLMDFDFSTVVLHNKQVLKMIYDNGLHASN